MNAQMQFNGDEPTKTYYSKKEPEGITGALIKHGVAKDEKQAQIILLAIAGIVVLLGCIYIFSASTGGTDPANEQPDDTAEYTY